MLCASVLVFSVGLVGTAGAEDEEPWAYDLASDLMSPFCPGRTVASCRRPRS